MGSDIARTLCREVVNDIRADSYHQSRNLREIEQINPMQNSMSRNPGVVDVRAAMRAMDLPSPRGVAGKEMDAGKPGCSRNKYT